MSMENTARYAGTPLRHDEPVGINTKDRLVPVPPSASLLGDAISTARTAIERVRHCRFYLGETADRSFGARPTPGNTGYGSDGKAEVVPPPATYLRTLLEQLHEEISVLENEAQRFGSL